MMSNLKSHEDELRAKMSKNAGVRIKRGLRHARWNLGAIYREIARNEESDEESSICYKSTSRSNEASLASNGKGDYKSDSVTWQFTWLDMQQ